MFSPRFTSNGTYFPWTYDGLKVTSSSYRGKMTDNQVVIVVQALLYFTQLVSKVIHGFMRNYPTNETSELTNNKEKKE